MEREADPPRLTLLVAHNGKTLHRHSVLCCAAMCCDVCAYPVVLHSTTKQSTRSAPYWSTILTVRHLVLHSTALHCTTVHYIAQDTFVFSSSLLTGVARATSCLAPLHPVC